MAKGGCFSNKLAIKFYREFSYKFDCIVICFLVHR